VWWAAHEKSPLSYVGERGNIVPPRGLSRTTVVTSTVTWYALGSRKPTTRSVNFGAKKDYAPALPDDFVFDDHRRTGLGRLESADDYVPAVAALFEQSPDVIIPRLYIIAEERHGSLSVSHRFGTLAEGGTFESIFVQLVLYRGDRMGGIELYELEDLDVARARFEELRTEAAA